MSGNIYLIGFMGSGKSTVASALSRKYHLRVVEMDEEIVRREGMSISDIFAQKGEPYFRNLETELLRSLKTDTEKPVIVSCGGGVPMRSENVELIREGGTLFLLTASPETILERVRRNDNRPLLRGKKNVKDIAALMEQRRPAYEAAADRTIAVDGKTPNEIAEEIMASI